VRIQLQAGIAAPRQARAAIRQVLSDWDMTALSDDAELLTSELVANAAEHAGGQIGLAIRRHRLPSGRTAIAREVTDSSPELQAPESQDLGLWAGTGGEGAKFWMAPLTDLKNRRVQDVFFLCATG
jgi:hypothetical protein